MNFSVSVPLLRLVPLAELSSVLMVASASGEAAICSALRLNGRHSVFQLPSFVSVRPCRVTASQDFPFLRLMTVWLLLLSKSVIWLLSPFVKYPCLTSLSMRAYSLSMCCCLYIVPLPPTRQLQDLNISESSVTLVVLQPVPTKMVTKFLHP